MCMVVPTEYFKAPMKTQTLIDSTENLNTNPPNQTWKSLGKPQNISISTDIEIATWCISIATWIPFIADEK